MGKSNLLFLEIKQKLLAISANKNLLLEEKKELALEKDRLKEKLMILIQRNKELEDENQRLKIVSAMHGNKEHRRLMKIKMNKLIREVDFCIANLKN